VALVGGHLLVALQRPRPVAEPLERPRSAPTAAIGELETEARRTAVLGLLCALRPLVEQIRQLTSEIRGAIRRHPDGPIFPSFFRDPKSVVCAAALLSCARLEGWAAGSS
jgi:hypothetical protein